MKTIVSDDITLDDYMRRIEFHEVLGRLDNANSDVLAGALRDAPARVGNLVVLDLSGVMYMNSAGLRELVRVYKQFERKGTQLVIANPSAHVTRLFELVGLDSVLHVVRDSRWTLAHLANRGLPVDQRHTHYCQ